MSKTILIGLVVLSLSSLAWAEELSWRTDIKPIIDARCAGCHGDGAPEYSDWMLLKNRDEVPPRMDSYPYLMSYVVWPATGALMRRLDDGTTTQKAGNMYQHLGDDDQQRAGNLKTIKAWLGEGAWNLNRWKERKGVPGITKTQLEAIKAKY
jgi:hypothetical protein